MKTSRDNFFFWLAIGAGALLVTLQSVQIFGPIGVFIGLGAGASLGAVIYYLGAMIWAAWRWICQQMQRP